MVVIDNSSYDDAIKVLGQGDKGRLPWNLDMFRDAEDIIADYGYALAVNEAGEDVAVLTWQAFAYVHNYSYSGMIDTEFIDDYECLILHGCNSFSVELCRTALDKWKGSLLVMVGEDWKYAVDMLPELDGKECIWEDALLKSLYDEIVSNMTYLHVTVGDIGEESMKRYEDHIMTYDEIMTFTYLFSGKKKFGPLNPNKKFWVFDAYYGNLGVFNVFNKAVCCARYAKKKGFIPVPRIINERGPMGIYQDSPRDDIWAKFYEQPEGYSLQEVFSSKNVYYSPFFYNASIIQKLMDRYSEGTELSWPKGKYNKKLKEYIANRENEFLPYPEKTLGVLARGTDYVNTHLSNHSIHASKEMICEKIDELLEEWGLEYIYLATEDLKYCEYFKERYKDRIFFTDQERFVVPDGQLIADMHRNNAHKREGFLLGAEYILSIHLLSKCNSLLASGGCAGLGEAKRMNGGNYKNIYVFDLGKNK